MNQQNWEAMGPLLDKALEVFKFHTARNRMKLARIHGTGIFAYHLHPFTINVQAKCRQI